MFLSEPGGPGVYGHPAILPAANASRVPGVLPQRLLQYSRQNNNSPPGQKKENIQDPILDLFF